MKPKRAIIQIMLFISILTLLLAGCGQDNETEEYSTVSNMIAERNKARFNRAAQQNSSSKKINENEVALPEGSSNSNQIEKEKSQTMTFEEEVRIVSEASGKTISMGTAYLDKSGKIISIRIKNR